MKLKRLISFSLLTFLLTGTLLFVSTNSTFSQANFPERVTFFCRDTFDRASEQKLLATIVWNPEKRGHIRLIIWKSEYFPAWSPRRRCEVVSPKFQKFYDNGYLQYLTNGKVQSNNKKYPVVCAVAKVGQQCNSDNQLFQLKDERTAEEIIVNLVNLLEGGAGEPMYQSSEKQWYVSIADFLSKVPTIEEEK